MAGKSQAALIAALLVTVMAAPAAADPVPLPQPAPQPKSSGAAMPPGFVPAGAPTEPASPAQNSGPNWLPPFFGGPQQPATPAKTFDASQRALVDKVSAYLSSVRILSGAFTQITSDGRKSQGQFYIQKPGKVRFEYDAPTPIDIIADGSSVVVRDRKLATQDLYPLSQTPLRFLLSDKIDLLRETNVIGVYADELFATVVIEEKQTLTGTSRLMMMFGAKDFQLKQWVITDPQGFDTTIAVSDLDSTRRPDPSMFKIDYTQYRN